MSQNVVVIGDGLIDELRDERGIREFVGGAALNVAVGLSRLGIPTTLIAMVGDDEAGGHIREYLRDYGVELIETVGPHGTSRAVSTRTPSGEPTYEFNAAAKARRVQFGEAELDAMRDAAMVVVSCFPFDDVAQTRELIEAVDAAGTPLAVDPNPRSGMLSDRVEFVRGFEALAPRAALVKVGDDDAELLYGEPLDALRARLIDLGVGAVLATQGSSGATIEAGADVVTRPISDLPGRIVDTMGGGDASLATTVAGMLGAVPADADAWGALLQHAMDVAAATCRFEGALLREPAALAPMDLGYLDT